MVGGPVGCAGGNGKAPAPGVMQPSTLAFVPLAPCARRDGPARDHLQTVRKPITANTSASLAASGTPRSSIFRTGTPGKRAFQFAHQCRVAGTAAGDDELMELEGAEGPGDHFCACSREQPCQQVRER